MSTTINIKEKCILCKNNDRAYTHKICEKCYSYCHVCGTSKHQWQQLKIKREEGLHKLGCANCYISKREKYWPEDWEEKLIDLKKEHLINPESSWHSDHHSKRK